MNKTYPLLFICLNILLLATGCSANPGAIFHTATNTLTKHSEPPAPPTQFEGQLEWSDENNSANSLCGALLSANINFVVDVNYDTGDVSGIGKIQYERSRYTDEVRQCADCRVEGKDSTFSVHGTLVNNTRLQLQPVLDDPKALQETQTSQQCFGDKPEHQAVAQQLFYSLQQGNFLNEWTIDLPNKERSTPSIYFQWEADEHIGGGTLTISPL